MERPPSFARFKALSNLGNVIPIHREIPADCITPVLAYLSCASEGGSSFLLESVEGGERIARYSFVGRSPYRELAARGRVVEDRRSGRTARLEADFLDLLRETFGRMHPVSLPGLPRLTGGAVGYISYEAVRLFDPAARRLVRDGHSREEAALDAWFAFYDTVLAFDHLRQSLLLITSVLTDEDPRPARTQYAAALRRLDRLASEVARGAPPHRRSARRHGRGGRVTADRRRIPGEARSDTTRSNMTRGAYEAMVATAKERIRAGEIYQVVLSQRFRRRLSVHPFAVYRALRRINPSPYMYFLQGDGSSLAGASPEMLVRVEGRQVELHPIAGTRPRGSDPDEDAALAADLVADPKERAEHVMLVDLGRNDLGRVCSSASVQVPEFMRVERFSHVMHLVSRVTGQLGPGRDAFDALKAAFPAGTVSGAPKIRAMEIIAELEPAARGPYAGTVCYIDYSGNLDSCIIIRTMVARAGQAYVQAGGGIVADSEPLLEYQESRNKARAVLSAIEGAIRWAR